MKKPSISLLILALAAAKLTFATAAAQSATVPFVTIPAASITQVGTVSDLPGNTLKVISNEPGDGRCSLVFSFDLESVSYRSTPLARINFGLEKTKVKRPGQKSETYRGALHAMSVPAGSSQSAELIGSAAVKPAGIPLQYTIDITDAVSAALARPAGQKKFRVEVRMTGKPAYYEVYQLMTNEQIKAPFLEIASPANWTQDWAQRLIPIDSGAVVYREACMPIADSARKDFELSLMYPAKKIIEVINNGTGQKLVEGKDWVLRKGKLILPRGSAAPIQIASEFFTIERKGSDGTVSRGPTSVKLVEGTFYHERQIEVTYEPASRDWKFPKAVSSLDDLPRLKKLLSQKAPVRMVLFGDSISLGGNASKFQGGWPYQPQFGDLVAWALEQRTGSKVTYMNHSRGGAGAMWASTQAASQAGWFKPDLAIVGYGMNDRTDKRKATYKHDLEAIIDEIRKESPETEIILVTSMVNNPKQPTGIEPIQELRDLALSIKRPGVAVADITTTHLQIMKRKPYLDTSGNGANHPNDWLQRIYAQRILEVLTP